MCQKAEKRGDVSPWRDGVGCSVSHDGNDYAPLAGFDIAFQVKDLLPGAQNQDALANRYGEIRAQGGGL